MDYQAKIRRFGFYYDDLEKLSSVPLMVAPTVRWLKLSQKTIKQAYKEMKELEYEGGTIREYLCDVALWNAANMVSLAHGYYDSDELLIFTTMLLSNPTMFPPCIVRAFYNKKSIVIWDDDFTWGKDINDGKERYFSPLELFNRASDNVFRNDIIRNQILKYGP